MNKPTEQIQIEKINLNITLQDGGHPAFPATPAMIEVLETICGLRFFDESDDRYLRTQFDDKTILDLLQTFKKSIVKGAYN